MVPSAAFRVGNGADSYRVMLCDTGRMRMDAYVIQAFWDDEAGIWVAESDDVPGLATGAATLDELVSKRAVMIPELLELNRHITDAQPTRFEVHAAKDREYLTLIPTAA
jgi:predicted RNase H-like HicB family nuclease